MNEHYTVGKFDNDGGFIVFATFNNSYGLLSPADFDSMVLAFTNTYQLCCVARQDAPSKINLGD